MAAKSTKKAKTPGPDGKKKSSIMEKRAQSEGSRATRSKTPVVKTPANANKSATKKTPKKTPKKAEVEEKKKLTFDDEEAIATPAAKKGMKPKTPKSSRKAEVSKPTPKGGATPKGKKATSEEAKQKTPKSTKKKDAVNPLPYGLDDEEYNEDEDDTFADMDGSDSDEESDLSEDDDESDADDDEEVVFNTPEKVKKLSEPVTSSLSPSKTKKTPKSAMKAPQTDNKPKKTPKSALKSKALGTAKSDKKVSLSITVPDEAEEKQHKKAATTPHPSLTKLKKRAPSADDEDNDKENQKNTKESSLQEEQLNKQLSFGDDNSEEDMQTEVKGQGVKRKHKATKSDVKPDGPPEKKGKQDGYLYHCGNLPNRVDKSIVKLFFSEAGVNVISIVVRNEKLTKMERTEGKDKKKGKLIKKKTKIDHCYGILKVATEEEGKKLEELSGIEFTAPQGRWRSHQLTIYPMLQRPVKEVKEDEPCVFVKLGYKIDDQQLRDFLTEHKVEPRKTFIVRRGIRQVSKGYGFAWFKSPEEVERAIKLSGKDLQGFKVDISQAKPKKNAKQHPYKIGSQRS